MTDMIQIPEPAWMKDMANDSMLCSRDVINAFGLDKDVCVNKLIAKGTIPPPTERQKRNTARARKLMWKVSELRKVFKKD